MASLRNCSREMLGVARDGIGWIALWKQGRSWEARDFFPNPDYKAGVMEINPWNIDELRGIVAADPNAILVNSWYHNLGDTDAMTAESLAGFLRWQYEECHPLLSGWTLKEGA